MTIEIHPYIDTQGLIEQLNLTEAFILSNGYCRGGIWCDNTQTIICGTFPPKKEYHNRKGYIHYSSSRNQFWKHIDAIYETSLFIKNNVANNTALRIDNALSKIEFAKRKSFGFVDVFTKVNRINTTSAKDTDLIGIETIFDNFLFEELIEKGIQQFIFVYSLSQITFNNELYKKYKITPQIIRQYNAAGLPLEVSTFKFNNRNVFLTYCPIHGNIKWELKQMALKNALEGTIISTFVGEEHPK